MAIRVGINGFGRIGRLSLRTIIERHKGNIQVVAVNDLTDVPTNAHLMRWDTVYGLFGGKVTHDGDSFQVAGYDIKVFKETEPGKIDWNSCGVDLVIESTGRFTDATVAKDHLGGSVKKVVISAPAKNEDATIVLGVNDEVYDPANHHVISNASCTTNGLAPVAYVLHKEFGIEKGMLTTVHAYTNSQSVVDTAKKDLRDSRAAAENVIPSSTGAAKAVGLVIPELKGKFTGMAFRVPVPTVSVVDFTAHLKKAATADQINAAMKHYATGKMKGILDYTEEELVSTDMRGNEHSSIFSAVDTIVIDDMCKVVAWYDNEWGYACRIADIVDFMAKKGM